MVHAAIIRLYLHVNTGEEDQVIMEGEEEEEEYKVQCLQSK